MSLFLRASSCSLWCRLLCLADTLEEADDVPDSESSELWPPEQWTSKRCCSTAERIVFSKYLSSRKIRSIELKDFLELPLCNNKGCILGGYVFFYEWQDSIKCTRVQDICKELSQNLQLTWCSGSSEELSFPSSCCLCLFLGLPEPSVVKQLLLFTATLVSNFHPPLQHPLPWQNPFLWPNHADAGQVYGAIHVQ